MTNEAVLAAWGDYLQCDGEPSSRRDVLSFRLTPLCSALDIRASDSRLPGGAMRLEILAPLSKKKLTFSIQAS
jgi:hypothetical protein